MKKFIITLVVLMLLAIIMVMIYIVFASCPLYSAPVMAVHRIYRIEKSFPNTDCVPFWYKETGRIISNYPQGIPPIPTN